MNALPCTSSAPSSASESFASRFGGILPPELTASAQAMTWSEFRAEFSGASGPIRLGSWQESDARGGRKTFDATFGIGDSIHSTTATSFGPIDALTSMLYDAGIHIEITAFHQQPLGLHELLHGSTATFVQCDIDGRREWAMAIDASSVESSIRAVIGAANLLLDRRRAARPSLDGSTPLSAAR
ncbi:hypothetical protein CH289_07485 [Rhodococcus sp. RS1C4]|uniref:alpha-isopropylmalate synthase regulatory domain-containing protein n=1 Tax=Nocardiaceae TaxID=85025 RepID=UPI0003708CEA|nr:MULTISPECIES: alpha-isopropylmalate synthase regulatory domain-containing protein [Rhodococcus]OZC55027.1 hypothetical protein CH289_07485 [Rhodococcus sp. RS1C4]OZD10030.1 hypothetical protein CH280_22825 [Rhodococcus sp. 06-156-4C]OZD21937.1 hypothetical protein CH253_13465 [Rhodococcus sp. 06-156-3C]OZD24192.1 hypothetical protein CH248_06445 [Rhodococcus sp. 06-156-4a]OZD29335.1 hypothetical protein CH247_17700 [Rhodococcus sp. 06-156-3b]